MNAFTKLEEVALNFILKHFRKIAKVEEFNELSGAELDELISRDELNCSEEDAFEAIVKWISIKPDSRSQNMGKLSSLTGAKIQFQFQLPYCPNYGLV